MAHTELKNQINWEIKEKGIKSDDGIEIPSHKQIRRDDDNTTLSIVRSTYKPLYNSQFKEVCDLISEKGFQLEGFSEFKNGKALIANFRNNLIENIEGLPMENYLTLGNGHDYQTPIFLGTVDYLIRCQNAFGQIKKFLKVTHSKNMTNMLTSRIIEYFNQYIDKEKQKIETYKKFAGVKIDSRVMNTLTDRLLDIDKKSNEEISTRKKNMKEEILSCIERETSDLGKNLFGFFNGVTYYTSHCYGSKNKEKVFGNFFNKAYDYNNKAFNLSKEHAAKKGELEIA